MFQPTDSGASASTASSAHVTPTASTSQPPKTKTSSPPPQFPPADFSDDSVRLMLFGTLQAVQQTVHPLHSRGYAEPNDWSPAISTGRFNEVMKILVKRLVI